MTDLQHLIFELLKYIEQDELARRIGVAQSTISYWKTGKRKPSDRHLPREIKKLKDLLNEMNLRGGRIFSEEKSEYETSPYPWVEGCREDLREIKDSWKELPAAKKDEYKVAVRVIYPKIAEDLIRWWESD